MEKQTLQSIPDIITLFVVALPLAPSENTVLTRLNTILTSILRKDHNIFRIWNVPDSYKGRVLWWEPWRSAHLAALLGICSRAEQHTRRRLRRVMLLYISSQALHCSRNQSRMHWYWVWASRLCWDGSPTYWALIYNSFWKGAGLYLANVKCKHTTTCTCTQTS